MGREASYNHYHSINIKIITVLIVLIVLGYTNSKAAEINFAGNEIQNVSKQLGESYVGELFIRVSGNRPFGINGDSEGNIYFVTGDGVGNGALKKRSTDGTIKTIASFHGSFIGPGLEIDEEGYFIIPIGDSVIKVSPDGVVTTLFSTVEMGIKRAINLVLDNQKNMFIVDDIANKLFKIDSAYRASVYINNYPGSEVPFSMMDVCFDKHCKNIYLAESYRSRILKYSIDENEQPGTMEVIYTNQQNANLSNVAIDEEGGIFVTPYDGRTIAEITVSGVFESSLSGASSVIGSYIANDSAGKKILYLTCPGGIVKVDLSTSTSVGDAGEIPSEFYLCQNFPNPFNPNTMIQYDIPESCNVEILIYNSLGQKIKQLANEYKNVGSYEVNFNAESLSSGVYFYSIKAGKYFATRKMILMK